MLRVGSSGDYPPCSARTAGGAWHGFDVEVARAVTRDRGRRLVLVPLRWPDLEAALARGDFDVAMSGVTVRPERLVWRGGSPPPSPMPPPCWPRA